MSSNKVRDNVESISKSLQYFGIADYLIFGLMLVVCSIIGLYFGYQDYKKKKDNKNGRGETEALDYLVGGRNLQVFPVAMSLVASFVSGIMLLGTSTEIYLYGFQYALTVIPIIFMTIFVYYVTIPVYNELNITSTYEVREFSIFLNLK